MRILFSITNLTVGGAQTFMIHLAREMAKKHRVYIFCLLPEMVDREILDMIPGHIKCHMFRLTWKKILRRLDRLLSYVRINKEIRVRAIGWYFKFLLKRKKIDLVHSHLFHSDHFVTAMTETMNIPVFITDHGCYNYAVNEGFSDPDNIKRIFRRARGVVYIASDNRKKIAALTDNHDIVFRRIDNGIPKFSGSGEGARALKQSQGIKDGDFVFGMVARGIKEKGWEIALQAFKELQQETQRPLHLVFIGDSPYMRELRAEATGQNIRGVHFLGSMSDPIRWVNCFDVGLLPSYFAGESLPMTIIEYLACGKPVIATNIGSIKEMVTHADRCAGMIFDHHREFNQNVAQLKNAMAMYLHNPGELKEHQRLAAQCFEKFNIEHIAREYGAFFREQAAPE